MGPTESWRDGVVHLDQNNRGEAFHALSCNTVVKRVHRREFSGLQRAKQRNELAFIVAYRAEKDREDEERWRE